jgi:hypothetical protein
MSLYIDSNLHVGNGPHPSAGQLPAQFSEITNQAPRPSKRAAAAAQPPAAPEAAQQQQQQPIASVPLPRSALASSSARHDSQFPVLSHQFNAPVPPSQLPAQQPSAAPTTPTAEMVSTFNSLVSQMQSLMIQWQQCYPQQRLPPFDQPAGATDAEVSRLMAQVGQLQGHLQMPPPPAPYYTTADSSAPYRSAGPISAPPAPQPFGEEQQDAYCSRVTGGGAYQPGPRNAARGVAMPNEPSQCTLTLVEFKRARLKKFVSDTFVQPGQYVIVEGDRGVDCGLVVLCCFKRADGTLQNVSALQDYKISEVMRIKTEMGRVKRIASKDDVDILHGEIASLERQALRTCREIAARMNLPMEIIDCEYQFDRRKVSFYFEAPVSVDFRELNTELFRLFGVRIWLENVNSKVKNVVPEGALSYADKVNFTKNGLRPPRRTQ